MNILQLIRPSSALVHRINQANAASNAAARQCGIPEQEIRFANLLDARIMYQDDNGYRFVSEPSHHGLEIQGHVVAAFSTQEELSAWVQEDFTPWLIEEFARAGLQVG